MELTYEQAVPFIHAQVNRKLSSFEDHHNFVMHVPYEAFKAVPYTTQEAEGIKTPFDDVSESLGQYFVLRLNDGTEVMVNTEGYDYCRYFVPIVVL